jgi:hypothetical protein
MGFKLIILIAQALYLPEHFFRWMSGGGFRYYKFFFGHGRQNTVIPPVLAMVLRQKMPEIPVFAKSDKLGLTAAF